MSPTHLNAPLRREASAPGRPHAKVSFDILPQARGGTAKDGHPVNAMTIDVEEYFQVEAFKKNVRFGEWDTTPTRVERSTNHVLQLMDNAGVKGTFFVLGWIARRFPELIRAIAAGGHEVASHGMNHERADRQEAGAFHADVSSAKALLEDVAGCAVKGYRAPTFSIGPANWWAYDVLEAAGYAYSSSLYPVSHDLYGAPNAPRRPFRPGEGRLIEIPMTTVRVFDRNIPCSGGGYFRLLPYGLSRQCLRHVNRREGASAVFYCHPWEFDWEQPRIAGADRKSRFRHYTNIRAMPKRFERLLSDFSWDRMDRVFLGQLSN